MCNQRELIVHVHITHAHSYMYIANTCAPYNVHGMSGKTRHVHYLAKLYTMYNGGQLHVLKSLCHDIHVRPKE